MNIGQPTVVEWGHGKLDKVCLFSTGSICVGSQGEAIPAFRWPDRLRSAAIHLSKHLFPDDGKSFRLHSEMGATDLNIIALIGRMQAELQRGAPGGEFLGEALGHELAVYLRQRYSFEQLRWAKGGLGARRRRLIVDYLHSHSGEPVTLSEMARESGLSIFHFSRAFKQEFNVSPYRFVLELRIEHAKRLLVNTSYDHAEIGKRAGFSSASHFARLFRSRTGLTPAAFRLQSRLATGRRG